MISWLLVYVEQAFTTSSESIGVTFWYNMYGEDVGSLTVGIFTEGAWTNVFAKAGDLQSDTWFQAIVTSPTPFSAIRFKSSAGGGSKGDIAVDDVSTSACSPCPAGEFSLGGAATSCSSCLGGQYSPSGAGACLNTCPSGTYTASAAACEPCAAGTSLNATVSPGATLCTPCAAGSFAPLPEAAQCTICQAGQYQASTGQSSCTACDPSSYCPAGSTVEVAHAPSQVPTPPPTALCARGSVYAASSGSCELCAIGRYSNQSGPVWEACAECEAGRFNQAQASTSCAEW